MVNIHYAASERFGLRDIRRKIYIYIFIFKCFLLKPVLLKEQLPSVTGRLIALTVLANTYWLEFRVALGKIIKKAKFYLWNPLVFNLLLHSFNVYLLST